MYAVKRTNLRNIAIIAHVDHGKTSLVDRLLAGTGSFRENLQVEDRVMDSGDLERERGITILAKNTAIKYKDVVINIVDTPGHADFGGEVERIMRMVDGVLLVVDAFEGCMPQTRAVLEKAFEQKLTPIVVVNKIDRENARPEEVVDEVLDLFIDLGADESQIDFPVIYSSAINGIAKENLGDDEVDMSPLLEAIIKYIPAPEGENEAGLQLQVTLLDYNDYLGRIVIGSIKRGRIEDGQTVVLCTAEGECVNHRIQKLYGFRGLARYELEAAEVGDIVAVAGLQDANVGDTICSPEQPEALPTIIIDEPTLQMGFLVNDSPFAGEDGEPLTSRKLAERLYKEAEVDVALRVEKTDSPDMYLVSGRGELHLSILIETMRREGLEFQVSRPRVIEKTVAGVRHEPFEELTLDITSDSQGAVMENLSRRKAVLLDMNIRGNNVRLKYKLPARGLIGFRSEFLTETKGYGTLSHSFLGYEPYAGDMNGRNIGVLIAWETGTASAYGIAQFEERGTMFVSPGERVYAGMVVGRANKGKDLTINVCREKQMTNMRSATKDSTVKLKAAHKPSLEKLLSFLADDEYLEITPSEYRFRKKYLQKEQREKAEKLRNKNLVDAG